MRSINFDPNGGPVELDVFIGQAQVGQYTLTHYDSTGHNPNDFGTGNNIDHLPDRHPIPGAASTLDQNMVSWVITIGAPMSGDGQLFFARVTPIQDGSVLSDGPFEYQGGLDSSEIIMEFARLLG